MYAIRGALLFFGENFNMKKLALIIFALALGISTSNLLLGLGTAKSASTPNLYSHPSPYATEADENLDDIPYNEMYDTDDEDLNGIYESTCEDLKENLKTDFDEEESDCTNEEESEV